MRRFFLSLIVALCALSAAPAFSQTFPQCPANLFTPNIDLSLPALGTQNWNLCLNPNFQKIDTAIGLLQTPFNGPWVSTSVYTKGAQVSNGGSIYISLINSNFNNTPYPGSPAWQLYFTSGSSSSSGLATCADSSGSATTQTCTLSPTTTFSANLCFAYTTTTPNTGALTLNVNTFGALPVQKWLGTALAAGDMKANQAQTACVNAGQTAINLSTVGNAPTGGTGTDPNAVHYNPSTTNIPMYSDSLFIVAGQCQTAGNYEFNVTSFQIASNVITFTGTTANGSMNTGDVLLGENFGTSTFLNGVEFVQNSGSTSTTLSAPFVHANVGPVTENGALGCSDAVPEQVSKLEFANGHGHVYNLGYAGGTMSTLDTNFSTMAAPLITTGTPFFIMLSSNEWGGIGACAAATDVEPTLASIMTKTHAAGGLVYMITKPSPGSNSIGCPTATAAIGEVNSWIRLQGKTSANEAGGAYWDKLITADDLFRNAYDPGVFQGSTAPHPGHFQSAGAKILAENIHQSLIGKASVIGPNPVDWGVASLTNTDINNMQTATDTGGAANVYAIAPAPVPASLVSGMEFRFIPANANTGTTPTLVVTTASGPSSAITITKNGTNPLVAGDLSTTVIADVFYDGTHFQLQNPVTVAAGCGGDIPCNNTPNTMVGLQTNVSDDPSHVAGVDKGSSAPTVPAMIQHVEFEDATGNSTGSQAFTSNVTAGHQLIALCTTRSNSTYPMPTDSQGNTWVSLYQNAYYHVHFGAQYPTINVSIATANATGPDTVNCLGSTSGLLFGDGSIQEWTSLQLAVDNTPATDSPANGAANTLTLTTANRDLMLAWMVELDDQFSPGAWLYDPTSSGSIVDSPSYPTDVSYGASGRIDQIVWSNVEPSGTNSFTATISASGGQSTPGDNAFVLLPIRIVAGGQTADLRQFQKPDGTVLSGVDNNGNFRGPVGSSETVSFSATPTFSTQYRSSTITLTGNITSFTLGAGIDGQEKTLCFVQDSTGSRTVAAPANVHGFFTVGTTASKYSCQHFTYFATPAMWVADSAGVVNQ